MSSTWFRLVKKACISSTHLIWAFFKIKVEEIEYKKNLKIQSVNKKQIVIGVKLKIISKIENNL